MLTKTVRVTVYRNGSMCFIPVPFDPTSAFGKVRAPVRVTLNGYTYRKEMSFSHQRAYAEAIDEAKKPDTRARRIAEAVRMIRARPAKQRA